MKFYKCNKTNNILMTISEVKCCNSIDLTEIVPGAIDASIEKHVPMYKKEGNVITVFVGSVVHPMSEVHLIEWIVLETNKGSQIHYLNKDEEPTAQFNVLDNVEIKAIYAYCNLHGLWVNKIKEEEE